MTTQELREKLFQKAEAEQKQFIDEMKLKPPQEIIDAAYRIVAREDVLMALNPSNQFLNEKQVKALLKENYPLEMCYDEWMRFDGLDMSMMQDTISDCADKLIRENEQAKANRRKNEPER